MRTLQYAIVLWTTLWMITSCGEDRSGEYYALIGENLWIEQVMKEHYLWCDSIPDVSENDYFATPESFLKKLVYTKALNGKGDNYSYIEMKDTTEQSRMYLQRSSTYGFDFELMRDPTGTSSHILARVLFVLPQSPASEAGIKRGDWIAAIGREPLTTNDYTRLMSGGNTAFARDELSFDAEGNGTWKAIDTVEIKASRPVELNPFFVDTVYHIGGKRIGYMVYNEFSTGPANQADDQTYRNQMKQLFTQFKSQSPDVFILDLRYNSGGYLSCANDLASYLAPASALGKTFCTLQYNDRNTPQENTLLLNESLSGANLNTNKLYVLTSPFTASASEAIINCLRPYLKDNLIVVGETTEGKNVAMTAFEDERYNYILWPVVAYVLNAEGKADYSKGITPMFELSERNLISPLLPLGDTREYLLGNTLEHILTGHMSALDPAKQTDIRQLNILYNTLQTRACPQGIRLP